MQMQNASDEVANSSRQAPVQGAWDVGRHRFYKRFAQSDEKAPHVASRTTDSLLQQQAPESPKVSEHSLWCTVSQNITAHSLGCACRLAG